MAAPRKYALKPNVRLMRASVKELIAENGEIRGVITTKGAVNGDKVILCTGGASYPVTGSDGYGYKLAKSVGHTIIDPTPSLVPITIKEKWCRDIMGLSLRNVSVTAYSGGGKKISDMFGEMIFTHFGVSGPIILSLSAHIKKYIKINILHKG